MKKSRFFIRRFNLIEITMAIAVVGIGIAGVMALFPPAIEANRSADNQNYLGQVSETLMGYLEAEIFSDFSKVKALSDSKKEPGESLRNNLTSLASKGIYGLQTTTDPNVLYIESPDGRVNAFAAVWLDSGNVPGVESGMEDFSRRVYVEISWPAARPYDVRNKKLYVFDVFNKYE